MNVINIKVHIQFMVVQGGDENSSMAQFARDAIDLILQQHKLTDRGHLPLSNRLKTEHGVEFHLAWKRFPAPAFALVAHCKPMHEPHLR